jgi:hypothetical protein
LNRRRESATERAAPPHVMGICPRGPITQLTRQLKRSQDSSSRRATGPSTLATEAMSDSICTKPMKEA